MRKIVLALLMIPLFLSAQNETPADTSFAKKMQWFKDAKLGIFIHWGIYAVNGIGESWSFYNGEISHSDYLKQTKGFTATNYHPGRWAALIKESGARYAVITSKHHDGFTLWKTKYGNLNVIKKTPAKRDVLTPFIDSLRQNGLKAGLYFSLIDWSYKDYPGFTRDSSRYKISDNPKRWQKFLNYYQGQLAELASQYHPDLWWFDGDWEHSADEWEAAKVRKMLLKANPDVIFNSRLQGHGDYATPEIGTPVHRPETPYWELCMTSNDSWGYQPQDTNYKTPQEVLDIFVDCISKGGNLLLDIGPKADGTIPAQQVHILKELGKWNSKHKEAVYGTLPGIPYDYFYGSTALSSDSTILYVYVRDIPKDNQIVLKGISGKIKNIRLVGSNTPLKHKILTKVSWNDYPGLLYINIPKNRIDPYYTVVAIEFNGKIKLYKK